MLRKYDEIENSLLVTTAPNHTQFNAYYLYTLKEPNIFTFGKIEPRIPLFQSPSGKEMLLCIQFLFFFQLP